METEQGAWRYAFRSRRMILGERRRGLIAATVALIGAVPVVDRFLPPTTHLAPVLGLAPALVAVYAGPRRTLLIGALAIAALAIAAIERSTLATETVIVQLVSLAVLCALLTFFTYLRDRRERQMARIRSVSEAAQRVVLHPLPQRSGPVSVASVYRAADADMHLGGDFYALARIVDSTRVIIGDVRGKGLASISETAAMLESFRAAARQQMSLPEMVRYMDSSVLREMGEVPPGEAGADERFVTLAIAEIPDDQPLVRLILCGHPAPLLLHRGVATTLTVPEPAPPLGLGAVARGSYRPKTFRYAPGDVLLLYTDGISEARDSHGAFYPLAEQAAVWSLCGPDQLVANIEADVRAYVGGAIADDMAMVAVQRDGRPRAPDSGDVRSRNGHAAVTWAGRGYATPVRDEGQ